MENLNLDQLHNSLGEPVMRSLVNAFYKRIRNDNLLSPLYPNEDWQGAEDRLANFLIMRFGGPTTYIEERGHPRLRMRHLPFSIGFKERDRWLELMDQAIEEIGIPNESATTMRAFFRQTADFMRKDATL